MERLDFVTPDDLDQMFSLLKQVDVTVAKPYRRCLHSLDFTGLDLRKYSFCNFDFVSCRFSGCLLGSETFRNCVFNHCELSEQDISYGLSGCEFRGCEFLKGRLDGVTISSSSSDCGRFAFIGGNCS